MKQEGERQSKLPLPSSSWLTNSLWFDLERSNSSSSINRKAAVSSLLTAKWLKNSSRLNSQTWNASVASQVFAVCSDHCGPEIPVCCHSERFAAFHSATDLCAGRVILPSHISAALASHFATVLNISTADDTQLEGICEIWPRHIIGLRLCQKKKMSL